MQIFKRLHKAFPPVIFSLGVLLITTSLLAQEVAPYEYGSYPRVDTLEQLERHKKFYLERLERSPSSGLDLAALANIYVIESNYTGDLAKMDKAEETARKSLESLPFYNEAPKITLAEVAESRHQFQEAITQASTVYQDNERNKGAISTLVSSSLGFGKTEEAITFADKLVEVSPDAESYTLRALSYLSQGKESEALADFKKALEKEGPGERLQSAWIRTLIGRHYYRTGNMEQAEAYTDSALKVLDNYHMALAQKADIEVLKGNFNEAEKLYIKAFKEREEPPYLLARADLKEKMNDPEAAKKLREEAKEAINQEIATTPYGHYNELAQVLIDQGNTSEVQAAIEAAKKDVEQRMTAESYYLLSQAYVHAGELAEAEIVIQEALKTGEKNCEYQALANLIQGDESVEPSCPQFDL